MTSIPLKPLSFGATYEVEKAALTSYEEGWDDFDGPIWPVGTNQCELQSTMVNISIPPKTLYFGAAFELEKAALTSYEEGWDDFDGPVWPIGTNQCELQAEWAATIAKSGEKHVPSTPGVQTDH